MSEESIQQYGQSDEEVQENLPPGVKLVRTLRGHKDYIGRIAWSPDGRIFASPSADRTIRLWNAKTGKCLRVLKGHNGTINSVAFDQTSQLIASGSRAKPGVVLWRADTGEQLLSLESSEIYSVAFNKEGTELIFSEPQRRLLSIDIKRRTFSLLSTGGIRGNNEGLGDYYTNDCIKNIAVDPSGGLMAFGDEKHNLNLLDAANGHHLATLKGHSDEVTAIVFDSESNLFSASRDSTIRSWSIRSGKLIRTIEGHTGPILVHHNISFAT